jgi:hypothetical protein
LSEVSSGSSKKGVVGELPGEEVTDKRLTMPPPRTVRERPTTVPKSSMTVNLKDKKVRPGRAEKVETCPMTDRLAKKPRKGVSFIDLRFVDVESPGILRDVVARACRGIEHSTVLGREDLQVRFTVLNILIAASMQCGLSTSMSFCWARRRCKLTWLKGDF